MRLGPKNNHRHPRKGFGQSQKNRRLAPVLREMAIDGQTTEVDRQASCTIYCGRQYRPSTDPSRNYLWPAMDTHRHVAQSIVATNGYIDRHLAQSIMPGNE